MRLQGTYRGRRPRRRCRKVENNQWFFDTELLLLAEERGLRIHEVPVDWVEDLDTRVKIVSTVDGGCQGTVASAPAAAAPQKRAALARKIGIENTALPQISKIFVAEIA